MKVLVTGDRNWSRDDRHTLYFILDNCGDVTEVVEGCYRGADQMAEDWASERGVALDHHPADWTLYGKAAGPIRNLQMLETKPDLVLAFHRNLAESKGTANMVAIARKAGINVKVYP
jgi:hypothetical protein